MDPQFLHTFAHSVTVPKIAQTDPIQPHADLGASLRIGERCQPFTERLPPLLSDIDAKLFVRGFRKAKCSLKATSSQEAVI